METAPVDHHRRETAYRHRGAGGRGPTLLCIHGSGGVYGVWRGQFRLANDYPVAALNLNSYDDSDGVDTDTGYETLSVYVNDVVVVAEGTGASVLVGNSFGDAVVLTLALERNLGLDMLVLTGAGARLAVLSDLLDWLENNFDRAVSFLHDEDGLFYTDDERLVEGSKEAMYDARQAVTLRDLLSCYTFDICGEVSEISAPMLALTSEYDRLTSPSYHKHLAETMPDGKLGAIEGAAHPATFRQPVMFNGAVRSFLDRRVV